MAYNGGGDDWYDREDDRGSWRGSDDGYGGGGGGDRFSDYGGGHDDWDRGHDDDNDWDRRDDGNDWDRGHDDWDRREDSFHGGDDDWRNGGYDDDDGDRDWDRDWDRDGERRDGERRDGERRDGDRDWDDKDGSRDGDRDGRGGGRGRGRGEGRRGDDGDGGGGRRGRGRDGARDHVDIDLSVDSDEEVPTQQRRAHQITDDIPSSQAAKVADGVGGVFEDSEFPAAQSSLGGELGKGMGDGRSLVWRRPKEYCKNPSLFKDGIQPGDIKQGGVGDCWLLGALSAVSTRPELLKSVIMDDHHADKGLYAFRFFRDGVWREVIIDDRIPFMACRPGYTFQDGRDAVPIMATSKDKDELWCMLLEKAFAKSFGSYSALDGGYVNDALVDLTGGVPFVYSFKDKDVAESIKSGAFVKELRAKFKSGNYLMSCALIQSGAGREEDTGKGVLAGHAYGILKIVEHGGETLFCIRNPWGQTEWKGALSDEDKEFWTPENLKKLGHSLGDDGTFWMRAEDMFSVYTDMDVCRLLPDTWSTTSSRGAFSRDLGTAGGCPNEDSWIQSPQYLLKIAKRCDVVVSLQQDDVRGTGKNPVFLGFTIFRISEGHHGKITDFGLPKVATSGVFRPSRQVAAETKLDPGRYVIVAMTFAAGEEALYHLHVSAETPGFTIKCLDPDNEPRSVNDRPPRIVQEEAKPDDAGVVRAVPRTVSLPSHAKKGKYKAKPGKIDDDGVKGLFDDLEGAWRDFEQMTKKGCKCTIM